MTMDGMSEEDRDRFLSGLFRQIALREAEIHEAGSVQRDAAPLPDPELVAAYLDGKLLESERRQVESQLAEHPELWRQLREVADAEVGSRTSTTAGHGGLRVTAAALIAASVLVSLVFLLWQGGSSRVEVVGDGIVVAVRGEARLADAEGEIDLQPGVRLGKGVSTLSLAKGARVELLQETGHAVVEGTGVRQLGSLALPASMLAAAPATAEGAVERGRLALDRAISPVCTESSTRPTFRWRGDLPDGCRLRLESIVGEVFLVSGIEGNEMPFPDSLDPLERGSVHQWEIITPEGSVLVEQLFIVAEENESAELDLRLQEVRSEIESPLMQDIALILLSDELELCSRAYEGIDRLMSSESGRAWLAHLESGVQRSTIRARIHERLKDAGLNRKDRPSE